MRRERYLLAAAFSLSLLYLWPFVDRGWIPHDDGMLGMVAERVGNGELPHRDFDDPYTGLLGYLHALGFAAFGTSVHAMRVVLYLATAAWLPAIYLLARRFVSPPAGVLVAALALTWSVPNYFAGVPSYYNVFLATFGTLALVRHVETGRHAWTAIAGACGGLSFLIKSAGGVYFAAAAFLFLVYREDVTWTAGEHQVEAGSRRPRVNVLWLAKAVLTCVVALGLVRLVSRQATADLLHFVMPGTLLALLLCLPPSDGPAGPLAARARRLLVLLAPFGGGFALPVLLFLLPYAWSGAVGDFVTGVFVTPARRFDRASLPLPPIGSMWPAAALGLLLFAAPGLRSVRLRSVPGALIVALLAALVAGASARPVYQGVWNSARHLVVFAVAAGCVLLASRRGTDPYDRQLLYLVLAMAAFMTLLQVPFAAPIYFAYGAPFLTLAITAVIRSRGAGLVHAATGVAYVAFAAAWLNSSYIWALGDGHIPYGFVEAPWVRRAGIRMLRHEAQEYSALLQVVERVHPQSDMLAVPDCPEVYFLSGRRNLTRYTYEFLSPSPFGSGTVRGLLDAHDIAVIVINRQPHFSGRLDPRLLRELEARYPYSAEAGRFLVRWGL